MKKTFIPILFFLERGFCSQTSDYQTFLIILHEPRLISVPKITCHDSIAGRSSGYWRRWWYLNPYASVCFSPRGVLGRRSRRCGRHILWLFATGTQLHAGFLAAFLSQFRAFIEALFYRKNFKLILRKMLRKNLRYWSEKHIFKVNILINSNFLTLEKCFITIIYR